MIYIGKYYSDIMFSSELFDTAILLYKPLYKCDNLEILWFTDKVVQNNLLNIDFARYVANILLKRKVNDESCLCYDYRTAINIISISPNLRTKFIGANSQYIDWLNNKTTTRLWLSSEMQTPAIAILPSNECTYSRIKKMYPNHDKFFIQSEISSGGKGTYFYTSENEKEIYKKLKYSSCYLVSPLIENAVTYNVHICVSNKQYWISPISRQISNFLEYHPLYGGSDFSNTHSMAIPRQIDMIAQKLKELGFRGICGVDFMIADNVFIYIECNNRFQGSSATLDYLLKTNNLPSLYQLFIRAHNGDSLPTIAANQYKQTKCMYFTDSNVGKNINSICFCEVPMYRHWVFEENILHIEPQD